MRSNISHLLFVEYSRDNGLKYGPGIQPILIVSKPIRGFQNFLQVIQMLEQYPDLGHNSPLVSTLFTPHYSVIIPPFDACSLGSG